MTDKAMTRKELKAFAEELAAKNAAAIEKSRKAVNLSGDMGDKVKLEVHKKLEPTVKFFNALQKEDMDTVKSMHESRAKALNEGTGSAGGFLVPIEFEKFVNRKVDDFNVLRRSGRVLPMSSNQKNLNELVTDVAVSIIGEGAQITESDPVFGEPILTARKYAAITAWTNELMDDDETDIGLANLLAERFAEGIAKKEEDEFVNGVTAGSEGLLQVTGTTAVTMAAGKTSFADVEVSDIFDMITKIQEYSLMEAKNAKLFMSPYTWQALSKDQPTNATYYLNPVPGGQTPLQIKGVPVELVNAFPGLAEDAVSTGFIVLSDLSKHLFIGDRKGMSVKVSEDGTVGANNLFEEDKRALRVVKRTANTTSLESGIVVLETAAA
jgi:HK97 family phage major capsid protein